MTPREILSEFAEQGTMRPEVRKALIAVLGELVMAESVLAAERIKRAITADGILLLAGVMRDAEDRRMVVEWADSLRASYGGQP